MGRLVFWLIVGVLFWLAVRLLLRALGKSGGDDKRAEGGERDSPTPAPDQIPMLQCAYCGVHFPASDAVRAEDGRVFCTPRHDQLAHHPDGP